MIAKHVPMRAAASSDFAGLVEYITDAQDKTQRLGAVAVTNCEAASLPAVIGEVLATQRQNTRAAGDKTFHLLVSFRAGEEPDAATLSAIEARLCEGLGYGEHQRVSAVHHDTDNLHIHVAINKIHPQRLTMHEPFQSYRTLAELCASLERDYGLEADNHQSRRSVAEGRAADMECHAGIESLVGWVRRECLEAMRAAPSWAALHQVMTESGLVLRARGNGLVVEATDGTRVKASTVARDLSRPALEARLGPFEAPPELTSQHAFQHAPGSSLRHYDKPPVRLRVDTAALYARYQAEQQRHLAGRADALASARRRKARAIEDARRANRLWRATIKVVGGKDRGKGISKKVLYGQASRALAERLAGIHAAYAKEREALCQGFRRRAWADWLKHEALQGNAKALAALRAREARQGLKGNTLSGRGEAGVLLQRPCPVPVQDNITKKGTIVFRAGSSAVRDDGDRLQVSREATREGVRAALGLALARYGRQITVSGTPEFKAQVIWAAVDSQLPLSFTDPAMELRRQQLSTKEKTHERTVRDERGSTDRRRPGETGAADGRGRGDGRSDGSVKRPRDDRRGAGVDAHAPAPRKPNAGRLGRVPPPHGQHRLRGLSELGVVRIAGGAEVLLPRDVPRHLEQQGAEPDHALRRGVPGDGWPGSGGLTSERLTSGTLTSGPLTSGPPSPAQLAAAHRYIAEREEKRLHGIDIPKHALYNECAGVILYAGLRRVEGQTLALLKHGEGDGESGEDKVMVLPVDAATARRLSRVALGDPLTVTPRGSIPGSRVPGSSVPRTKVQMSNGRSR